ncbi:MAG TPA: glycerol kinase GlpK [Gaiellaceae bacterium]|nr:glycerol kinase GlpK [Gaiellaceae bacterium]
MTTILAVDQGTTSTKAVLVSSSGETIASSSARVSRTYPRPGWVEQDPNELWDSVGTAIRQLPKSDVACVAVTNQRESVIVWDRESGRPLTRCVSWQCTRGADFCAELRAAGAEHIVREITGLPLDPMFSASKLRHLLDADPALRVAAESGSACAGTIDSWLLWKLTGGELHGIEAGNASRTLLFDVHRLAWSEELLELFGVPSALLPRVLPSSGLVGESVPLAGLPALPIAGVAADSHAALYGLACFNAGTAKATYGTGTSLMSVTGLELRHSHGGLATTVAWLRNAPTYALEGNVFSTGATIDWLTGVLGLETPAEVERLAETVPDSGGVHLVPAFVGLGAPHWQPEARAQITGLTFGSGPAELARAALDSTAFQVADLVDALALDLDRPLDELRVDGGASSNDGLMQLQADLLGCPVVRTNAPDAAALGVAFLGGLAVGLFVDEAEIAALPREWDRFEPKLAESSRDDLLAGWRLAVSDVAGAREAALS